MDSTLVEIQPDIKCLVGKNESGKTAFVEALRRLKPAQGNVEFSSPKHYPSWLEKRHRREAKAKGEDLDESSPITAIFGIEKSDKEAVSAIFGDGVLLSEEFEISRKHTNKYGGAFQLDEHKAVANFLAIFALASGLESLIECQSFGALRKAIIDLTPEAGQESGVNTVFTELGGSIDESIPVDTTLWQAVWRILFARTPQCFDFSQYSSLPSIVQIRRLLAAKEDELNEEDHTALALLKLAEFEEELGF